MTATAAPGTPPAGPRSVRAAAEELLLWMLVPAIRVIAAVAGPLGRGSFRPPGGPGVRSTAVHDHRPPGT